MRLKLALLVLFVMGYGIIKAQNIFGGVPTDISEVPWQVSIERNGSHWCGGSILNAEWIISAAHCTEVVSGPLVDPNAEFIVHAGSTSQLDDAVGQRVLVDQIIVHPDYDPYEPLDGNDIVLLHLAQPLCLGRNVRPIPIANQELQLEPGTLAIMSGWGNDGNGVTENLRSVQLPLISDEEANDRLNDESNGCPPDNPNTVDATMVAFYAEGMSTGRGDSGGPAVVYLEDTPFLLGVTSFGGCPSNEFPSVFTDVRVFSNFILDNISPSNSDQTEVCCGVTNDLLITSDETWDSPRSYGGNVVVINGVTLGITSYVEFGEYKKLIIQDGGRVEIVGSAAILNDCPDASRWDGIEVQSGGSLIVDEGYIYSALYGIHALPGSSIDVSTLVAFGTGWTQGVGIWLEGSVNVVRLFRSKIGGFYSGIQCDNGDSYYNIDQGEITDCFTGIDLNYTSARINDFDIIARNDAISAFQSPGLLIENNYLNTPDNNTYPDSDGVNMWWCAGSVLRNNTIGTNWQAPRTGISLYISNGGTIRDWNSIRGKRTGIFAFSTDFSIIENDISVVNEGNYNRGALTLMYGNGNQILNNHIDAQNVTFGVNTRLCNSTQIENNKITTLYNATYHRAAGIKSEGCTGEIIANNVVTGKGNADAIIATNTVGNTYDCNEAVVEGNKEALSVLYNSQGQSVKGNKLSANGHDLLIRSIIGTQSHEGNEFMGGNALAEGQVIATGSRFFVNSTYAGHMPGNPQPEDWFTDEPTIHNYYLCANDPGPDWMPLWDEEDELCAYYLGVVGEHGYGSRAYLLMIQSMVRYSQQRIQYELPNCITRDLVLSDCWVQLAQVEKEIRQIDNDIDEQNHELAQKIAALSDAYKDGSADQYLAINGGQISSLTSMLSGAELMHDSKVSRAKELLDGIDCTDPILDQVLPILKQYIKFLQTEDKSTFDYSELIEYSRLCADDYGPYVHLARSLVYPITEEYFDQYDNCRSVAIQPLIGSGGSNHAGTLLYPNPSAGLATIDFATQSSGSLQVLNIAGKVLMELEYKSKFQVNIDLSKYPGVNFIHIHHEDGTREVLKHISFK